MMKTIAPLDYVIGSKKLLDSVTFDLSPGFYGLVGNNGAGKTTLLRSLIGEIEDLTPYIKIDNYETLDRISPTTRSRLISWLPAHIHVPFAYKCWDIVTMGRYPWSGGQLSKSDQEKIEESFSAMKIESFKQRIYTSLSTGEKQLVQMARVLVQDTPILILDEPFANLDVKNIVAVCTHLKELASDGKLIVSTFHDISLCNYLVDNVILMKEGQLLGYGETHKLLTPDNLQKHLSIDPQTSQFILKDTER